jgi:aspartate carbamoyltransferase catalytic subunit
MQWRHRHLISLEDWTREELEFFLGQADYMEELMNRPIKKFPLCEGR